MAIALQKKSGVNPILILLLLLATGVAVYFYLNLAKVTGLRNQLSVRVNQLESENSNLSTDLAAIRIDVDDKGKKIEQLSSELSENKTARKNAEEELKRKSEEMGKIQQQYDQRILELERDVKRSADFNAMLTKALQPIKDALLEQGGEEGNAAAGASRSALPSANATLTAQGAGGFDLTAGQVLSVNRDYGFIVTSLGSSNGVKEGSTLQVYRKDQPLGLCRVDRVQEKISAATIVNEDLRGRIENGDRVVLVS